MKIVKIFDCKDGFVIHNKIDNEIVKYENYGYIIQKENKTIKEIIDLL